MSVGEICNRRVVTAEQGTSILDASELMRHHHVGDLIVVDMSSGLPIPVGIITDRDIVLGVLAKKADPEALIVQDAMSTDLLTAKEEDGILETLQRMRAKGVRRVPIVNHQNSLIGILTLDDLLELLAGELGDLVKLIGSERDREEKTRP
jgi:CBS domain-containing protein